MRIGTFLSVGRGPGGLAATRLGRRPGARGGVEVSIWWKEGRATRAVLKATVDGRHKLRAPKGQEIDGPDAVELKAGQTHEVKFK